MQAPDHKYFVFIPNQTQPEIGTLQVLSPIKHLSGSGLIVIPYAHPFEELIKPQFYHTIEKSGIRPADFISPINKNELNFVPSLNKKEYIEKVKDLKKHIARGDIYEINFCMEFVAAQAVIDPWQTFQELCLLSKAPYHYFVKLDRDLILCASPELFLKKTEDHLISKPIKGTARRSADKVEDQLLKDKLYNSLKERTENVMAVDVTRNDLSMLASKGSVQVNKLYNIESFETVHQMVSTVSCDLKPEKKFEEILTATFPMASMTGAPKISAMNLISASENFKRKYYSGALGLYNGEDFELAVVIRSLFYNLDSQQLSFATGGAITHLCDPEQEYEECLLKAQSMLKAVNGKILSEG